MCLTLAKKGAGHVSPNPLVGCVIVKDGVIIGKGFHKRFGKAHAEVEAVKDAKQNGYSLKGAVVYVNLEPCSHFGKTPPCTELLINEKVSEVVIGMEDPNPEVKGIKILRRAGISVKTGVLKDKCEELNKFFIKYITQKLPYITLKIAQSADGKISDKFGKSKYITGVKSRKFVHKLRSEYDAVLVGANTVLLDNPELTVRDVKGRNPLRVIISGTSPLKSNLKIFKDSNYFLVSNKKSDGKNVMQVKSKNGYLDLKEVVCRLYERGISSLLVEGGAKIFSEFVKLKLVDEIIFITAPVIIGNGLSSFEPLELNKLSASKKLKLISSETSEDDIITIYKCSQEL